VTIRDELAAAKAARRPDELQKELIKAGKIAAAIAGCQLAVDLRYWYRPRRQAWDEEGRVFILEALGLVENLEEHGIRTTELGDMVVELWEEG
jgi:hypothetical protein